AVGNNNSISQPAGENVSERMVFNILWKSASNVVTIRCRINKLSIPSAVLNSGANFSIMSLNIAKKLGLDIDRNKTASLEGIATESDTIGR
ncbi:14139_t:CDS:2, partial [Entrophospora sp. SA101]